MAEVAVACLLEDADDELDDDGDELLLLQPATAPLSRTELAARPVTTRMHRFAMGPLSSRDVETVGDRSCCCAAKRRTWEVNVKGGDTAVGRIDLIEDRPRQPVRAIASAECPT